jgi:hypothetical protein
MFLTPIVAAGLITYATMKSPTFKIFTELEEIKGNYEGTSLEKVSGLYRSQSHVIKMCEYYSDSRYLGANYGNQRSIGQGKLDVPFYNIVNFRVALAKTATDLDIKDIQIISDNPKHQVHSMLLNREVYEWMKEEEFSKTLNQMGVTRPKYGGYLLKRTEAKGKLEIEVVKWTNVFTDQTNILGGPIVECHHMSPVDIKKKDGIWNNVIDVLKAHKKLKDRAPVIDVYEITGEFPIHIFKNSIEEESTEEEEYTYSLQRYFVASVDDAKYLMYSEELSGEMDDYYEYLTWEDNGYGLGRGVIEDSEEAQVWTNDAVINESIAMALAGRVGIKTNSKKLGNNVLEHDHGKIYELEDGKDINAFNLAPSALGQYQNQIEKWNKQATDVTSSYDAATGESPVSGTPYSTTSLLNQVATKPFDYKREEWGIHLTKIFTKWVIPFVIKKIKKEHILVSEFSTEELEMIDESFAIEQSNKDIVQAVLNGGMPTPQVQQNLIDGYKKHIKKSGKKRYIEVPEDYFKDIECKITILTTGEQKNKAVLLQSLSEIAKFVTSTFNPTTGEFGALKDPTLSKLFNEMLELAGTGISPISLGNGTSPTKSPANPVQAQAPVSPVAPMQSPALTPMQ